ncbi:hypothetical protein Pmani_013834 [Petrolisthes manimaculis]|uniref:Uncharacterized protein n=1 Tax=Petrolisthes manimaculis TaxID=1843537 RepID=A0AAE1PXK1_9EUCA|nr:hypothetical protein Pmani_013834 [Petrolisthes manimaculis]
MYGRVSVRQGELYGRVRPAPIMQPDRVLKLGLIMTPPTPPTPPEAKFIKLQGHDQLVFGVGSYRNPLLFPEGEDNEGRNCVQTRSTVTTQWNNTSSSCEKLRVQSGTSQPNNSPAPPTKSHLNLLDIFIVGAGSGVAVP